MYQELSEFMSKAACRSTSLTGLPIPTFLDSMKMCIQIDMTSMNIMTATSGHRPPPQVESHLACSGQIREHPGVSGELTDLVKLCSDWKNI